MQQEGYRKGRQLKENRCSDFKNVILTHGNSIKAFNDS